MPELKYLPLCQEALQGIPAAQLKSLLIPVAIYVQEAEDLAACASDDADRLLGAGLPPTAIDELPLRAGALAEAQSLWQQNRKKKHPWNEQRELARHFRDGLLHDFRYAFRNNKSLLSRLNQLMQGNSYSNMIQDLNDLAVLGAGQLPLLESVGFDTAKLKQAADLSAQTAFVWADFQRLQLSGNPDKTLRDRAYTYLKLTVDQVRNCGQYVFPRGHERYPAYCSAFLARKNRSRNR